MVNTFVFLTTTGGGTTWTKDATWNDADNRVHVIGAGGRARNGVATKFSFSGIGGGGGAYTFKDDVNLSGHPTTVPYQIGIGNVHLSNPIDTWFVSSTEVKAQGGSGADPWPAEGGAAANCIPSANAFSGGQTTNLNGGLGGSGAAGPSGAGGNVTSGSPGGTANGGTIPGATAGAIWTQTIGGATAGPGGGGNGNASNPGMAGALYGGGGGAASGTGGGAIGGNGAAGIIVLEWAPAGGAKRSYIYMF